jgi:alkylation response protein AidB-like acyl-CoA dehydrogenase
MASDGKTFIETALQLGGKTQDEARRVGALDQVDNQVEVMYEKRYQTSSSPVHRAVWDDTFPVELFNPTPAAAPPAAREVMDRSLELLRELKRGKDYYGEDGRITEATLQALNPTGYWGLLIDPAYGGSGAPFAPLARFMTEVGTIDPTIAGMASVHGCIGAVGPLLAFGTEEQKKRWLPELASGRRLSAFALTEPCAGSDLTALRTRAVLDGDHYVVTGEKLFITNVLPGRTIGLVCLIDGVPSVLIVDLPPAENEHFQIVRYKLHALRHQHNYGLKFNGLRVPRENRLVPPKGDGLTIAYHGLNRGRVALSAGSAATMRLMLASILPWARLRRTYGQAIEKRELVRSRVALLAGLTVACDAITEWCGWLLDEGYRGELECMVAKVFASEAGKEAAIEILMKTHGGRSFLKGHLFGDNVHDYLAPCIYEGEGEMLGLGFFKSLVKAHSARFFEPIGKVLAEMGIKRPNMLNPIHAWKLRGTLLPYTGWQVGQRLLGPSRAKLPDLPGTLAEPARFAAKVLQDGRFGIDGLMRKHELKLPDRQCLIAELSRSLQNAVVILVTALYGGRQQDPVLREAAGVLCETLQRRITGARPDGKAFRRATELGAKIAEGGCSLIAGIEPEPVLMPYANE